MTSEVPPSGASGAHQQSQIPQYGDVNTSQSSTSTQAVWDPEAQTWIYTDPTTGNQYEWNAMAQIYIPRVRHGCIFCTVSDYWRPRESILFGIISISTKQLHSLTDTIWPPKISCLKRI